jgi:hypothetical protein
LAFLGATLANSSYKSTVQKINAWLFHHIRTFILSAQRLVALTISSMDTPNHLWGLEKTPGYPKPFMGVQGYFEEMPAEGSGKHVLAPMQNINSLLAG